MCANTAMLPGLLLLLLSALAAATAAMREAAPWRWLRWLSGRRRAACVLWMQSRWLEWRLAPRAHNEASRGESGGGMAAAR